MNGKYQVGVFMESVAMEQLWETKYDNGYE